MEDELTHVPFALHVQPLEAVAWSVVCLGLIFSAVVCFFPSSPYRPLLPPATTHLRLPPSLGWTLHHIPRALGL